MNQREREYQDKIRVANRELAGESETDRVQRICDELGVTRMSMGWEGRLDSYGRMTTFYIGPRRDY